MGEVSVSNVLLYNYKLVLEDVARQGHQPNLQKTVTMQLF